MGGAHDGPHAGAQDIPLFNLKAVVQQTGLKPDALRAWERRYGLPSPNRSGGRHRLYTQRDLEIIRWLMARQREGLTISRAVELWRTLVAEGLDPLREPASLALPVGSATEATPAVRPDGSGDTLDRLREAWLAACRTYDEQTAKQVLAEAFALYPPETVCLELLQKAIAQVGDGWYQGTTTVQQEHFASALAVRQLESLISAAPLPIRLGRILVACPPQEDHVFGLLLLTLLLRRRGWPVVFLGANVPVERLETVIAVIRPQLVIAAAQQLHTAATLLDMAHSLQSEQVPLAYGGRIFNLLPALRDGIAGYFLGARLDAASQVAETLMAASPPLSPRLPAVGGFAVEPIAGAYRRAREHYRERIGLIEADLAKSSAIAEIGPGILDLANRELALKVSAALTLGSMDYLDTDVEWLRGLVANHHMSAEVLSRYLQAYHQAARRHLDERGKPIIDWLGRLSGFQDPNSGE